MELFIIFKIPEKQCQNFLHLLKIILHLKHNLGNLELNLFLQF